MEWKPSPELTLYDEARVARLDPVNAVVQALPVPLVRQGKLNSILNALEMQIEDGGDSPEVNGFLIEARRAGIRHQVGEQAGAAALRAVDEFAQAEEERWAQVRAGTLPPIVPTDEEQLDDLMQEGYELLEAGQPVAACDLWLEAWDMVKRLATPSVPNAEAFDAAHPPLMQSVFNWAPDLLFELANAGLQDPTYYERLLRYAQEYLAQFSGEPPDKVITFERERADALWALGRRAEAEAAHARLIARFPDQGWAYIGWSDLYAFNRDRTPPDYERAAAILQEALARPGLLDRKDVLMRVREVSEAWGRPISASSPAPARKPAPGGRPPHGATRQTLPAPGQKLGRNDRCWCGSGKKYKHCHLDADAKLERA